MGYVTPVNPNRPPSPAPTRLRRLTEQMTVMIHQAVGMTELAEAAHHLTQHPQPGLAIASVVTIRWRAWPRLVT